MNRYGMVKAAWWEDARLSVRFSTEDCTPDGESISYVDQGGCLVLTLCVAPPPNSELLQQLDEFENAWLQLLTMQLGWEFAAMGESHGACGAAGYSLVGVDYAQRRGKGRPRRHGRIRAIRRSRCRIRSSPPGRTARRRRRRERGDRRGVG